MPEYLFEGPLSEVDPAAHSLTELEAERQFRRLILIPSESTAPLAVRQALASRFNNIYAEGYPPEWTRTLDEDQILDYEAYLSYYRRYSDPRYYKGVEYADIVEALARRRCAELFATPAIPAEEIFVNVQPLSGAPANNAVYHALVEPGEVIMGMNLLHGGHLTHGSPVNRSGKLYQVVHYGVNRETEKIDYDQVAELAQEHKPRMIIAGYSSYPWSVDWTRFREIADQVGAYLLADVAHIAGLIAAGILPSPIGIADIITFTTHKSLCGPRGAVILSTQRKLAKELDRAVFPGEQGGPHINNMIAQAVAFKLAATEDFQMLQRGIVENCVALTDTLREGGLRIPFGGTDTHLTNVDCTSVVGADGTGLSGDQAARILDVVGIVTNRNTIPGDTTAARPSGVRLGTTWITQRGFTVKESVELGELIVKTLKGCQPYSMAGRSSPVRRAKIPFELLNELRLQVRDLAQRMKVDFDPPQHGYPHFYYPDDPAPTSELAQIRVKGERTEEMIRWVTDALPADLQEGDAVEVTVSAPRGSVESVLHKGDSESWSLFVDSPSAVDVTTWLRDLSDGYVTVDPEDLHRKIPGPVIVRLTAAEAAPETNRIAGGETKPWYIRVPAGSGEPLPPFRWEEDEGEVRETALHDIHVEMGAKMVPFAGWDMPVWYSSVVEEHNATREAAGLFDVSHMGVYVIEGPEAYAFLDSVVTNEVAKLAVGESLYTQFLAPDASVIDDTMVYRYRPESFLVVVNAANDDKDWAWLNAVKEGKVRVDESRPWALAFGRGCRLRNLRDPEVGEDMRVDLALQGPKSRDILLALGAEEETGERLRGLKWAGVMEGTFGGFDLIVSRTGYTGERVAYELFIHPDRSVGLWNALLEVGEAYGLKPVGLGARDSLRTEAGLPLYGHEMAGERELGVGAAGFGAYVKTHKPWFVGRKAFLEQESDREGEVVRFRFDDKGVRMAHYGDPVVDRRGRVIGFVTSCAVDSEGYLLGQAFLGERFQEPGTPIAVFQSAGESAPPAPASLQVGDRMTIPTPATVLSRFP